jgi:hypothetical protein
MNKIMLISILASLLILTSCVGQRQIDYSPESVGVDFCYQDKDCTLPPDVAIRTNCQFETRCQNNTCLVVCPLYDTDPLTNLRDVSRTCSAQTNCTCEGYFANDSKTCSCIREQCMVVLTQ